ncbi:MAG: rRNA E-loop-binding protein [Herbinix sp.]|jgi:large subunit ribosomal protein L25|nr:rRNA E-loop-binding protein [Herbinix sp.]
MNEITLDAIERADGKFKENGYVAGILYGDGVEKATAVKFEEKSLNRLLTSHGNSAKLWININNSKKFGFIKEVQRKHLVRTVTHVDVQIVSKDHEIKIAIPITYKGDDVLRTKQLQLQVYKSEITVFGKMALMPDGIEVDVSEMNLNDTITLDKLGLDKLLKIENEDAVYGTIINLRALPVEEVVEPEKK